MMSIMRRRQGYCAAGGHIVNKFFFESKTQLILAVHFDGIYKGDLRTTFNIHQQWLFDSTQDIFKKYLSICSTLLKRLSKKIYSEIYRLYQKTAVYHGNRLR